MSFLRDRVCDAAALFYRPREPDCRPGRDPLSQSRHLRLTLESAVTKQLLGRSDIPLVSLSQQEIDRLARRVSGAR